MLTRTTTALLDDLADPANEAVWCELDARYRPVLVGFGRRLGLGAEDAADAAQEALVRFVGSYRAGKYDRGRGRLSSWVIGITRNCIVDQMRSKAARHEERGMSAIVDLPGADELAEIWIAERDREILRRAVEGLEEETRTDPRTLRAFKLVIFHQLAADRVAGMLDMTRNDVYLAKHRCLKRLRRIIEELTVAFETEA